MNRQSSVVAGAVFVCALACVSNAQQGQGQADPVPASGVTTAEPGERAERGDRVERRPVAARVTEAVPLPDNVIVTDGAGNVLEGEARGIGLDFTYQGRLRIGGVPANGNFSMTFSRYNTEVGPGLLGATGYGALPVTNGLFSALVYGSSSFDGSDIWIEVAVEGNVLSPRQKVTPTPYALKAASLQWPVTEMGSGPFFDLTSTSGDAARFENQTDGNVCWVGSINAGVEGRATDEDGVLGRSDSGAGVRGASNYRGVQGDVYGAGGSNYYGLWGDASAGSGGFCTSVYGGAPGSLGTRYAGYFVGNVSVIGTLSKGGGSFKIDHPLDPYNKFLSHSFVESPDMMNIYNGNAVFNAAGQARVTMPDYFEALNREFRYQLTAVGAAMPNLHVASKMNSGSFVIAGGAPGAEVSWQVTGVRQDSFANENRIPVEEFKQGREIGKLMHPTAFGRAEAEGIDRSRELEDEAKSNR